MVLQRRVVPTTSGHDLVVDGDGDALPSFSEAVDHGAHGDADAHCGGVSVQHDLHGRKRVGENGAIRSGTRPVARSSAMQSAVTGRRGRGATSKMRCVDVAALFAAAILRRNPGSIVIPFDTSAYEARVDPSDSPACANELNHSAAS